MEWEGKGWRGGEGRRREGRRGEGRGARPVCLLILTILATGLPKLYNYNSTRNKNSDT